MKTKYTIKNFRVFDKKGATVEFAPLTFLVGCNSSGKSSIVKSLSLLKTFFMNDFSKENPIIGSTIDFSVNPNDSLGNFKNVVRSSSREKVITLSYEIRSALIDDDVEVSLSLGEGDLGNAVVTGIEIKRKDGAILAGATSKELFISGDLCSIKSAFLQYLMASRLKISRLDDYSKRAIDKFAKSGIITYFSILDEIGEMTNHDEIRTILKSKISDMAFQDKDSLIDIEDVRRAVDKAIDFICDEFAESGFADFFAYYRSLEDMRLMPARYAFPIQEMMIGDVMIPFSFWGLTGYGHENMFYFRRVDWNPIDEKGHKYDPFSVVYDLFSLFSREEPYSYLKEFDTPVPGRVHPLFTKVFMDFVREFILEIVSTDVTENLDYIGSSRIQVRRMYPMDDRNEFTNTVRKYFEAKTKLMTLNPPITLNVDNEDGLGHHAVVASDFVPGSFMNKWLQKFEIGDHISLEMDKNGLSLLLKVYKAKSDKKGTLLADMGYGITQLFSILLQVEGMIMEALYSKFRDMIAMDLVKRCGGEVVLREYEKTPFAPRTVAIEEPEIHLHPKFQSLLAEMLYEAYCKYNIQFIVETHSEYLLRKVQTLISLKHISPEDISMIYVEDESTVANGVEKVRKIPVKADGRLADSFGPGFYDEADNLSLELFTNMGR